MEPRQIRVLSPASCAEGLPAAPPLDTGASPLWHRLEARCVAGGMKECYELGAARFRGVGGRRDARGGLALLLASCENGVSEACRSAASAYLNGIAVRRDRVCSEMLLQRACAGGDRAGCLDLAERKISSAGVYYDPVGGREALRRLCPGDASRCAPPRETRHLGTAATCAAGDWAACEDVGAELDESTAIQWFTKACVGGSSRACARLASPQFDFVAARRTLIVACDGAVLDACAELLYPAEHRFESRDWQLSETDRNRLTKSACAHGYGHPCRELALAVKDPDAQLALLEQSCPPATADARSRDGYGCRVLAEHVASGSAERGRRASDELLREACFESESRDEDACAALVPLLRGGGVGVARDEDRAADVMAGLCSVGSKFCAGYTKCDTFGFCDNVGEIYP